MSQQMKKSLVCVVPKLGNSYNSICLDIMIKLGWRDQDQFTCYLFGRTGTLYTGTCTRMI